MQISIKISTTYNSKLTTKTKTFQVIEVNDARLIPIERRMRRLFFIFDASRAGTIIYIYTITAAVLLYTRKCHFALIEISLYTLCRHARALSPRRGARLSEEKNCSFVRLHALCCLYRIIERMDVIVSLYASAFGFI